MKLIVALGNPGLKYEKTKHNTGFMALDYYLKNHNLTLNRDKFDGLYAKEKIGGEDVIFLEPQTYMNESGKSVAPMANFFKIDPADILVIHDDMDMPVAKLRIRAGGKSGGHNGIKSIIASLGTEKFNRLKIGIKHPDKQSVVSWVLTPFDADQQALLDQSFETVDQVIDDFIAGKSAQYLMNRYN
ncbi:Peptidyl-tRNA hydrolase [Lactobacillus equicursoris DSM 19284 = JCM 14600 = CIP 110162]|uniref:Peptidyl-tRNA hydrolase n=3 Tax=Lactobacillus equicursoris TaxID=420645 RepID=K0NTD2_9LACO|nr:aminoacyl-tRNA hydrolase [Lactobacillus equicursoris]KRL01076.1 peptidyl-tRNA hydrolase [Lactobacillus equicursoris DSM 19284 = JCM 14600 = CIP 110162]MDD6387235.1 aminoacyl-tRNA hydrolase [Lactobacillus equicursoris]MDD6407383.1 aminoacyl-tRNA hydrolase [Lactobacillus equicursoris]MST79039.1 aminoacyl-tRNA hydrolase [Lactobacillus equicursoris]CCK83509.1 Peptidyl-tRNA hydrolase [Lactobacillus equicursoris 66c]